MGTKRGPRRCGRPTLTETTRGTAIVTVGVGSMDFLNSLGDWFQVATAAIERFITFLFGSANRRRIRKFGF